MTTRSPIELNLYNDQDEVVNTLRRNRIPSYLLDLAINLQDSLANQEGDQKNADALFDFILEFYGSPLSRDELKKQTDLVECMSVLKAILTRASSLTLEFAKANPRVPSPKKK